MSISGGAAIQAALLQLGVYDPGETPSTSEQNSCLLIANEMLANWYNEQLQALQVLITGQNKAGSAFIAGQVHLMQPFQDAYVLAGVTYTPPTYTAGTVTGGGAPAFPDLTTPQTFPTGYELAIVLNLAVKLGPQYPGAGTVTDDLRKSAMDALAAAAPVPGRMPIIGGGIQGAEPPTGPAGQ
jgi:hypothetical protein